MTLLESEPLLEGACADKNIVERARAVAEVAERHASQVDKDGVFPAAAIAAAKRERLLSMLIPRRFGGDEARIGAVADACYILGQACGSTALIVAMHQAALACVVRHAQGEPWPHELMRRIAAEQLLLASSTTEGNAGGNVRSSVAALIRTDDRFTYSRSATVMSYGLECDGVVSTARRNPEAGAAEQSLVVLMKDAGCVLTPAGGWDTLGMRGTCSRGFALEAEGSAAQILPTCYARIHPVTMVPVSHITWAAVWTGIAAAAVGKAQMFVRTAARRAGGQMPPGAGQATRATASLNALRGMVAAQIAAFEAMETDETRLTSMSTQASLNLFKVEASEHAVAAVQAAMRACGLAGYRNDGEFGIGRHLRDVLSAPVMVHNERILSNIANAALMSGIPETLADREAWQ